MSDIENAPMSLADIAGVSTDQVEELRSSQLPIGRYTFEVAEKGGVLTERNDVGDDNETRYIASVELKVVEVDAVVEKGISPEDVLGKTFTETFFINPAEAEKGIGYLKGFIADIGAANQGAMGGVEGAEPGYLNALAGHRFVAKIVKKKGRDGEMYSRLQLEKKAKG